MPDEEMTEDAIRRWTEPMLLEDASDPAAQRRTEAWRIFFETGDKSLLVECGIFEPDS